MNDWEGQSFCVAYVAKNSPIISVAVKCCRQLHATHTRHIKARPC
jgi:hypothetical protein